MPAPSTIVLRLLPAVTVIIGGIAAQTTLGVPRVAALPDLRAGGEAEPRGVVADVLFAAELEAVDFDIDAEFKKRKREKGGDFRAGDGLSAMAKKEIAETVGCRGWQQLRVEALGDGRYHVELRTMLLDAGDWTRRESMLRALCDGSGRIERAVFGGGGLGPDEYRELVVGDDGGELRAVKGNRRPKRVAELSGARPTVPPLAMAVLPGLQIPGASTAHVVDWTTGEVASRELQRTERQLAGAGLRVEFGEDGSAQALRLDEAKGVVLQRTDDSLAAVRQQVVNGGTYRFGFARRCTRSVTRRKKAYLVGALGLQFDLPGVWGKAKSVMPSFDTVLHVEEKDDGAIFRLLAKPLDSATTLQQFTAPRDQAKIYAYERKPTDKPKVVKVDGVEALLERFHVESWGRSFEAHDLRVVVDGVGYTAQIMVPSKKAKIGRSLVKKLRRSWKVR